MAEDSSELAREMTEAVAATNVKVVAEGPSYFTNIIYGNAASNQQNVQALTMSLLSKATENILNTSPSEGMVDITGAMQLIKGAQTTPPVTP